MVLLCILVLIFWPVILGPQPGRHASIAANKAYAIRFVEYVSLLVLFLLLAAVSSILIMRRAANEFRELQRQNMQALLEATLADQRKKANNASVE
jgi:hypothetical protein